MCAIIISQRYAHCAFGLEGNGGEFNKGIRGGSRGRNHYFPTLRLTLCQMCESAHRYSNNFLYISPCFAVTTTKFEDTPRVHTFFLSDRVPANIFWDISRFWRMGFQDSDSKDLIHKTAQKVPLNPPGKVYSVTRETSSRPKQCSFFNNESWRRLWLLKYIFARGSSYIFLQTWERVLSITRALLWE